jgi:serine/threonine protein phosphatase PrpC
MAVELHPGDALVLASDGVEVLDESTIVEVVPDAPSATQAARRLVDAALARGATDNVTVAVVRHRRTPAPGPAPDDTDAAGAGADR